MLFSTLGGSLVALVTASIAVGAGLSASRLISHKKDNTGAGISIWGSPLVIRRRRSAKPLPAPTLETLEKLAA